ncbi:MAG: hypothetical protein U9Q99_01760 [Nanoarchaeota archaeon]|nr:hypothetical protein [Nanoarchaeota archaeon]
MVKTNYILENKTPKENHCIAAACPAIYEFTLEVTPPKNHCIAAACPTIYKSKRKIEGEDVYLIIGKKIDNPSKEGLGELEKKIGEDEILIEVPRGLIDNLNK